MNRSDAPPASTVNKTTWSRYVTLDSLISLPALAGGASEALMLPPCTHTLRFIIILYESCNRASFKHLGQLLPINYVYIVAFAPNLQRASFYSVTEFLPYSTAIKLLPLHNTHERSYRALEPRYNAKKF